MHTLWLLALWLLAVRADDPIKVPATAGALDPTLHSLGNCHSARLCTPITEHSCSPDEPALPTVLDEVVDSNFPFNSHSMDEQISAALFWPELTIQRCHAQAISWPTLVSIITQFVESYDGFTGFPTVRPPGRAWQGVAWTDWADRVLLFLTSRGVRELICITSKIPSKVSPEILSFSNGIIDHVIQPSDLGGQRSDFAEEITLTKHNRLRGHYHSKYPIGSIVDALNSAGTLFIPALTRAAFKQTFSYIQPHVVAGEFLTHPGPIPTLTLFEGSFLASSSSVILGVRKVSTSPQIAPPTSTTQGLITIGLDPLVLFDGTLMISHGACAASARDSCEDSEFQYCNSDQGLVVARAGLSFLGPVDNHGLCLKRVCLIPSAASTAQRRSSTPIQGNENTLDLLGQINMASFTSASQTDHALVTLTGLTNLALEREEIKREDDIERVEVQLALLEASNSLYRSWATSAMQQMSAYNNRGPIPTTTSTYRSIKMGCVHSETVADIDGVSYEVYLNDGEFYSDLSALGTPSPPGCTAFSVISGDYIVSGASNGTCCLVSYQEANQHMADVTDILSQETAASQKLTNDLDKRNANLTLTIAKQQAQLDQAITVEALNAFTAAYPDPSRLFTISDLFDGVKEVAEQGLDVAEEAAGQVARVGHKLEKVVTDVADLAANLTDSTLSEINDTGVGFSHLSTPLKAVGGIITIVVVVLVVVAIRFLWVNRDKAAVAAAGAVGGPAGVAATLPLVSNPTIREKPA